MVGVLYLVFERATHQGIKKKHMYMALSEKRGAKEMGAFKFSLIPGPERTAR